MFAGSGMGVVFAVSVMRIWHARIMSVVFARSGRRPPTRMNFGRLMVVGDVTDVAAAHDLRLLQRVWHSSDAQNEHEKGHGKQDAHFSQVVVGATIALWLCWSEALRTGVLL